MSRLEREWKKVAAFSGTLADAYTAYLQGAANLVASGIQKQQKQKTEVEPVVATGRGFLCKIRVARRAEHHNPNPSNWLWFSLEIDLQGSTASFIYLGTYPDETEKVLMAGADVLHNSPADLAREVLRRQEQLYYFF